MQESTVKSVLSQDELLTSLQNGLVKVGVDNSVLGETQYFLYLSDHYDGTFDAFRTVFLGSIPGADIVEETINGIFVGRMSGESVDFLMRLVNGNPEFVKLLEDDLR